MADRDVLMLDLGMSILTAYNADGFLGVGVDVPGGQAAGTTTFQAHFPFGIIGRPRDPDQAPNGTPLLGASLLYGYAGNSLHAWPLGDPRALAKLPQVPKGTWGAYGDTGRDDLPLMVLDGDTGSFALRVPHSTGNVSSRVLVDVETGGAEEIVLAHGAGPMLTVHTSGVRVDDGDFRVGPTLAQSTMVKGNLAFQAWVNAVSAMTGVPAPVGYLTSFAFLA